MESRTHRRFWAEFARLPPEIRSAAHEAYGLFSANPAHPSLHFHRLVHDPNLWSARVGRDYRAVGAARGNTITWFWIGSHADFDKEFPR